MKILVCGATGKVGSAVIPELLARGAGVRALARKAPAAGKLPAGVEVAIGDLLDPPSLAAALAGVDKLFLLNAVAADELTQALIGYGMARRAGVKHITYLSVYKVDRFPDVPHFASKLAVERALHAGDTDFTILRPGFFYQNEVGMKALMASAGIYPMAIGSKGIAAVDIRDIAEAAAITLTQPGHAGKTYSPVGPGQLTGPQAAEAWSAALGKKVVYPGENWDAAEAQMRQFMEAWRAYDMRVMLEGYYRRGFLAEESDRAEFTSLLGHAPRSHAAMVQEWAGR
ncbi:MAG TPA: NmrA family NAD(P)-binding protein [Terriglobales bacterium]|nr:NmrA family NAD(P)-binding protein [Terriglobales bacterium]